QGRDVVERFVRGYLQRDMTAILATEEDTNPKGTLQEVMQERYGEPPEYETIAAEGPDHARQFTVAVVLNEEQIGIGKGRSKREAQQAAARKALVALGVVAEQPDFSSVPDPVTFEAPVVSPGDVVAETPDDSGVATTISPVVHRSIRSRRHVRGSGKREG
ncbi:MAG TPA: putative dsRNA-binding protein, partial [Thermomicrobiales bacterium]|nr:putative dsRNA-binding protein [Thermomicrobiales bacterium]